MNKLNQFFKVLYSSPSLLWKAGAGLIFIFFSLTILFVPSVTLNFDNRSRYIFSALLAFYGLFRSFGFYIEYKNRRDE